MCLANTYVVLIKNYTKLPATRCMIKFCISAFGLINILYYYLQTNHKKQIISNLICWILFRNKNVTFFSATKATNKDQFFLRCKTHVLVHEILCECSYKIVRKVQWRTFLSFDVRDCWIRF